MLTNTDKTVIRADNQLQAKNMTNAMLIEYMYKQVHNIDEFIAREDVINAGDVTQMLGILERLVQHHIDLKAINPTEEI